MAARTLGRQWSALCGLGAVTTQDRQRSKSLYASQCSGLVRADHSALRDAAKPGRSPGTPPGERTTPRGSAESGEQQIRLRHVLGNRKPLTITSFTTAHSIRGSSSAFGISNLRLAIRTRLRGGGRRRFCFARRTRPSRGRNSPDCAATARAQVATRAPGECACHTIVLDPTNPKRMFVAHFGGRRVSKRRCREHVAANQPRIEIPIHSRIRSGGRSLRPPHCHAPFAPRCAVHAEALGRHAQRQRRRLVARNQRESATDFGFAIDVHAPRTGDDLRRTHQERRRTFSSGWEAASVPQPQRWKRMGGPHERPAATRLLRLMCCATRWQSTRWTNAGSISALRAVRCMPRRMPETTGHPSCGIFRQCFLSRSRRCHDPGCAPSTPEGPGARVRRGGARHQGSGHATPP